MIHKRMNNYEIDGRYVYVPDKAYIYSRGLSEVKHRAYAMVSNSDLISDLL